MSAPEPLSQIDARPGRSPSPKLRGSGQSTRIRLSRGREAPSDQEWVANEAVRRRGWVGILGGMRGMSRWSDRSARAIQSPMSGPRSARRERRAGRSGECWSGSRERSRKGRGRLSPSMAPSASAPQGEPLPGPRNSRRRPLRHSTPSRRERRPPRETTPSARPSRNTTQPGRAPRR